MKKLNGRIQEFICYEKVDKFSSFFFQKGNNRKDKEKKSEVRRAFKSRLSERNKEAIVNKQREDPHQD